MQNLLNLAGTIAGGVGVIVCIAAGVARLLGHYYVAGYGASTLFGLGAGLMILGCLLKLEVLVGERQGRSP